MDKENSFSKGIQELTVTKPPQEGNYKISQKVPDIVEVSEATFKENIQKKYKVIDIIRFTGKGDKDTPTNIIMTTTKDNETCQDPLKNGLIRGFQ
eukprot:Awhi_evm1s10349